MLQFQLEFRSPTYLTLPYRLNVARPCQFTHPAVRYLTFCKDALIGEDTRDDGCNPPPERIRKD
jgi:hypothetical protein